MILRFLPFLQHSYLISLVSRYFNNHEDLKPLLVTYPELKQQITNQKEEERQTPSSP